MTASMASLAWVSAQAGSATGQCSSMRKSPAFSPWGNDCQISSVIKGMKGWRSFSVSVSTYTSTCWASSLACWSSPWRRALVSSIYQSQKSLQMKSYTLAEATPSSKASMFSVTSPMTSPRRQRIHLSSSSRWPGRRLSSTVRFICTNRLAFQILLAKLRMASHFST